MTAPPGSLVGLATGAEMRLTGEGATAVVCVNGGQASEVRGNLERVARVARAAARAAVPGSSSSPRCATGSSRGGGSTAASRTRGRRSSAVGREPDAAARLLDGRRGGDLGGRTSRRSSGVLGLAPWIPDRLSLEPLRGKRLDVLHGSLDRWLPGIPGVSPALLAARLRARPRARRRRHATTLIRGALHGIALRAHRGRPVPLPRAAAWARRVAAQLAAL